MLSFLALFVLVLNVLAKTVPPGTVYTDGQQFMLDGKPFDYYGANSYWLPLLTTKSDVDKTLSDMQNAGVKVLRVWGFNAINETELANATRSGLTYYQVWNSSEWQLNDGPQGLQRLDYVVDTAAKHGICLILTFTNNWVGYGGMELYINWIIGSNATHDQFYTDPRTIASYQKYVKTIVERYKNKSNIFAWELMNEARCSGDGLSGSPSCNGFSGTLTNWYKQQSDFVRSLDPVHMIATGGEGHFAWKHPRQIPLNGQLVNDYNYDGGAGENFNQDIALDNIDFGVYHLYPQSWYAPQDFPGSNFSLTDFGLQWISDHANAAKKVNKPIVIEEFGMEGLSNKTSVYPVWVKRLLDTHHGGIMPWQFGELGLTEDGGNRVIKYSDMILNGASPNDEFTIYPNQTALWNLFTNVAKVQNARSG